MFEFSGSFDLAPRDFPLTFVTESHVIRGTLKTRLRRLTDVLNQTEQGSVVLTGVAVDDLAAPGDTVHADVAQVSLASVLFAIEDHPVGAQPEMRLQKSQEDVTVLVGAFRIVGHLHVLPGRDMREALGELSERFVPLTDATYWSERAGVERTAASMVAINRARAHILAPQHAADPWGGFAPTVEQRG